MRNSFSEKLLLLLSRNPDRALENQCDNTQNISNALDKLINAYGVEYIATMIKNKEVIDFGCGLGYQTVAIALHGAKRVVGIDIIKENIDFGKKLAARNNVQNKIEFYGNEECILYRKFDLILSLNSFEHYNQPKDILQLFCNLLTHEGKILLTFSPPWYSAYGSHMHFFTKLPYVNILFSEKTVMNVRKHYRYDGANKYEEISGGLNKMTVLKFESIVKHSDLECTYLKMHGIKGIDLLTKIPLIRELFTTRIDCILSKL